MVHVESLKKFSGTYDKKRTCPTEKPRALVFCWNTEMYHRKTLFAHLLYGVIFQMNIRFSKHCQKALQLRQIFRYYFGNSPDAFFFHCFTAAGRKNDSKQLFSCAFYAKKLSFRAIGVQILINTCI